MLRIQILGSLLLVLCGSALANSSSATQTLSANLGPAAKVAVVQPVVNLLRTGPVFTSYSGSVELRYRVRTTPTGSCTLSAIGTGDFTPAGGPSTTNGDVTFTCGGATLGTACSGTQTVKTGSPTAIVTVGGGACAGSGCPGADPNSVVVTVNSTDSPAFQTGSYSTNLTFSIGAN
jgi:hypothetical protein